MKKYLLVLALFFIPFTLASVGYGDINYGVNYETIPTINYTTISVNDSTLWDGNPFSYLGDNYVPYTGANKNVDLGDYKLTVGRHSLYQSGNYYAYLYDNYYGRAGQLIAGVFHATNYVSSPRWITTNADMTFQPIVYYETGLGKVIIKGGNAWASAVSAIDGRDVEILGGEPVSTGNYGNVIIAEDGGNVGIGTATPQNKLNVIGDGNFTGNLYAGGNLNVVGDGNFTGYLSGKNYVTQYHRNASIDTTSADTWVNVTWDLLIDDETTSGYSLSDSNVSIIIANSGIYRIQGCLHPKNNGVGIQESGVYSRILINGIEAKCLQFANSKEFKSDGIDTMPFIGTIYTQAGQKVQLQYYVTSLNIDFEGDDVFDDGVAGSINFERISI